MRILHTVPRIPQRTAQCGPTSLAQILRFKGFEVDVKELERSVGRTWDEGTHASFLGALANQRGYASTLYVTDLAVFDPTWNDLAVNAVVRKLRARHESCKDRPTRDAIVAYLTYLDAGGTLVSCDLTKKLLIDLVKRGPFIAGVNATYLYVCSRTDPLTNKPKDVTGEIETHFFVVDGYDPAKDKFHITDPEPSNPFSKTGKYWLPTETLLGAMHLADARHDCCVLVVK